MTEREVPVWSWIDATASFEQLFANVRAITGPGEIPGGEDAARRALEAFRNQTPADPRDLQALAYLIRRLRPAPLSREGLLDELTIAGAAAPLAPEIRDHWEAFRERAREWLPSIGVLIRDNAVVGTGFVVDRAVIATNRHVLGQLSDGMETLSAGSKVRFVVDREMGVAASPANECEVVGVRAINESHDVVLLTLSRDSHPVLKISTSDVHAGDPVVVVGHPLRDPQRNPLFLETVFNGIYGMKRGSIGKVLGSSVDAFYHDASTTGGNSGSPIFRLSDHALVGMHASGVFLFRNQALLGRPVQEMLE